MPGFESPIGSRNFQGQGMREVEVPDISGYTPPNMDEIREFQARAEQHAHHHGHVHQQPSYSQEMPVAPRQEVSNKISESARKRIEMLLGMSQTIREVKIENNVFVLRSLKAKEMREALTAVIEFDGTVQGPYEIRKQLLGRSLTHVAGIEIGQFLGSNTLESKFIFIEELDESLANRLYDEYLALSKESKEKYGVKNSEDAKEVVEDIKKA